MLIEGFTPFQAFYARTQYIEAHCSSIPRENSRRIPPDNAAHGKPGVTNLSAQLVVATQAYAPPRCFPVR